VRTASGAFSRTPSENGIWCILSQDENSFDNSCAYACRHSRHLVHSAGHNGSLPFVKKSAGRLNAYLSRDGRGAFRSAGAAALQRPAKHIARQVDCASRHTAQAGTFRCARRADAQPGTGGVARDSSSALAGSGPVFHYQHEAAGNHVHGLCQPSGTCLYGRDGKEGVRNCWKQVPRWLVVEHGWSANVA
jgi:hypothetical protein